MTGPRSGDELAAAVEATGLLAAPADGPLLLMCSAGRDSHTLLDIAVRLLGPDGLHVLHVDHGLREASTQDAAAIVARCEVLGVASSVRRAGARPEEGGNLHAWARGQRQRLASAEMDRLGARAVATAHTRTDLVETALGRLATQPGRRALLSMRAREGQLVRPLLGITREETAAYCRARGITWRDDPSNDDERYARARLRHGVVPVLRSLNPRAEDNVVRTLEELAEESEVLDALVDAELRPAGPGDDGPSITAVSLDNLPVPLARLVLRELCERTMGRPVPRAGSRLEEVLALSAPAGRAGLAAVDLGGGARIELRGGVYRCRRSEGQAAPSGGA
ncbi:MAG: tRNA lysidine(34) synthetase TilS [Solirubrobacteraceae bacterium]|nr:tRNA lysidine(34) synthetase TilS [Solirubrobacteraceae bacterium]